MTKCKKCRKEVDYVYTACLLNHKTIEGVCAKCRTILEQQDIDDMTYECFEKMCQAVNGGSTKDLAESMFRTFTRQHRYLQSEFMIALWEFFKLYGAQDENHRDARNEGAVNMAKRWDMTAFEG